MILTNAQKAGAAAAFMALAIGIAYGTLTTGPEASAGHIVIRQDGGIPAGAMAVWVTALGDASVMARFGVDAGGASSAYFRGRVCALPQDAGAFADGGEAAIDPGPNLLPGLTIVYDDATVLPCASTDPDFEGWMQGRADAPFPAACAIDATCLQPDGGPAPLHVTLNPGSYVPGPGCMPKAAVELAGISSWPSVCP